MHTRSLVATLLVFGAAPSAVAVPPIALDEVATGLTSPLTLAEPDDGSGRLFIVDQTGQIWIVMPDGTMLEEPFLDIADRMVTIDPEYDERGLLGLAFDPNYAKNGRFYVSYSAPLRDGAPEGWDHTNNISRFEVSLDPNEADMTSEDILLEIDKPQFNHNVSTILFGGDGYLYIGVGDGGGADDVGEGHVDDWYEINGGGNGQDITTNLLGSILRLDVRGDDGYTIPVDNPFMGREGLDEIYAYGFRNPYRFSWDEEWGLIVGDVGQGLWEEIDLVSAGGNYGWNVKEGTSCFNAADNENPLPGCPDVGSYGEPLIDPVFEYPHEGEEGELHGFAIVGGHVYRGNDVPYLKGRYIFGDWSYDFATPEGTLVAARPAQGEWNAQILKIVGREENELGQFLTGIAEDQNGELYVLAKDTLGPSGDTGVVYRMVAQRFATDLDGSGPGLRAAAVFSTAERLHFELTTAGQVTLEVYDAAGRSRRSLIDAPLSAGSHEIEWDGQDDAGRALPAGVYFYQFASDGLQSSRRVVIVR